MRGSVMLRHDELAFIKAISTLHKKLWTAGRRNAPVVSTVRRGTTTGRGRRAELAGKRKANELASSGGSAEPANRRPAIGAGTKPLPATTSATGEQAASTPLQANAPQLPIVLSPNHLILPQGPDVRSVLPDGHVNSPRQAGWSSTGRIDLPCPLQPVCQRHAPTLTPRS